MEQPLKVKLTESDIRKMVKGVFFHLNESFDNIFTMSDEMKTSPLMEGYYMTYDPKDVAKFLKKRYGKYAFVETYKNENNIVLFRIGVYNDIDSKNVVDKDMNLCGYYPSKIQVSHDKSTQFITYEPRHQNKINELVRNEKYIYHLTPTTKVEKILKNGLSPKTNNKKFQYPDRVYFFLHQPTKTICLNLIKQFHREEMESFKNGKIKTVYNGTYTLLKIDTKKIQNIDFSYDPNAFDAIWTYQNIQPDAIEKIIEIR